MDFENLCMSTTLCEEINRIPSIVLFLSDDKIPQNRQFSAILNTKKSSCETGNKQACEVDQVSQPQSICSFVTTFSVLSLECARKACGR